MVTRKWAHLFLGAEPFLKAEAIQRLKAELGPPDAVLAFTFTSDDPFEPVLELLDAARPLLTEHHFIVLADVDRLPESALKPLLSRLETPRPHCGLVLTSEEARMQDEPALRELASRCLVRVFRPLDQTGCARWLQERATQRRKRLDQEAGHALMDRLGTDLALLAQALEQLSLAVGERPAIAREDVERHVGHSVAASTFTLVDQALAGRTSDALQTLHLLLLAGVKPHDIVGALTWQLKQLLRLRRLMAHGASRFEMARELKISHERLSQRLTVAGRFDAADLERLLARLFAVDWGMKRGTMRPELALEIWIVEVAQPRQPVLAER